MKCYLFVDPDGYVVGSGTAADDDETPTPLPGTTAVEVPQFILVQPDPLGRKLRASDLQWVDARSLDQVKYDAEQRMFKAWYEARAAGVTIGTKTAPTDTEAWVRYMGLRLMAGEAGWVDVPIPLADGTFEVLTLAKAQTLWASIKDMERTLYVRLRDRVGAIRSATTKEQVEAVVW